MEPSPTNPPKATSSPNPAWMYIIGLGLCLVGLGLVILSVGGFANFLALAMQYGPVVGAWLVMALPTIIVGLSNYPQAQGFLTMVFDFLSIVTHKNSPNSLKLPFTRSNPPLEK